MLGEVVIMSKTAHGTGGLVCGGGWGACRRDKGPFSKGNCDIGWKMELGTDKAFGGKLNLVWIGE